MSATRPVAVPDNTGNTPARRAPLVLGDADFAYVTETVCRVVERPKMPRAWYVAFACAASLAVVFGVMVEYLILKGVGVWGLNSPVSWGFAITNFVFWVGIGHAGTLISAILFLLRQKWRTAVNRFAEAMTIFAVICAGLFPAIHLGRIWLAYWLFPLPNQMEVWPNFRSPLLWDVFAVGTYMVVSLLFWYMGMIPDLATLRDRAETRVRWAVFGALSLGWRASNRHWHRFEMAYLLLAALATPLVVSVHSVVSFDFAVSILPGWHTTIFPPYFVAGAIFSGFAMVVTLIIPVRHALGLERIITARHLDNMAKIILATGMMVGLAYATELLMAFYSGNQYEGFTFVNRAFGPYGWAYWIMVTCNVAVPQLLWSGRLRRHTLLLWVTSVLLNVGMWFERFVIVVTSLSRDFLPSAWGYYRPTTVDILTMAGSFGLFLTLFLLFVRFGPMIGMAEVKSVMPQAHLDRLGLLGQGDYHGEITSAAGPRVPHRVAGAEPAPGSGETYGYLLELESVDDLVTAAARVREAGYTRWDAHAPFVVHGLDRAMGIRATRLPYLVLGAGLGGATAGIALQWWTNAVDYPYLIGGMPLFSLPANVPVTFELAVLVAAITTLVGMIVANRLPRLVHPLLTHRRFLRSTDDRFFISVEAADPKYDATGTPEFLASLGGVTVERVGG